MKKGTQLLIVIFIIQTIASCCRDVEFFDYDSMIVTESGLLIENNENLELLLVAENVDYLSLMFSQISHNKVFALSCDEGWGRHEI